MPKRVTLRPAGAAMFGPEHRPDRRRPDHGGDGAGPPSRLGEVGGRVPGLEVAQRARPRRRTCRKQQREAVEHRAGDHDHGADHPEQIAEDQAWAAAAPDISAASGIASSAGPATMEAEASPDRAWLPLISAARTAASAIPVAFARPPSI